MDSGTSRDLGRFPVLPGRRPLSPGIPVVYLVGQRAQLGYGLVGLVEEPDLDHISTPHDEDDDDDMCVCV